jgi:cysteinyl-tRNA synthetase, unknown class
MDVALNIARLLLAVAVTVAVAGGVVVGPSASAATRAEADAAVPLAPPRPQPAARPAPAARATPKASVPPLTKAQLLAAEAERLRRINLARSWGYQLNGIKLEDAQRSPYDMLIVDATTGLAAGRHFKPSEVAQLKIKPDGSPRLVLSYLSVGESEDYRPEYFSTEYMEEEAPDWLRKENPDWKGNRIIAFCHEGWQKTILGDDNGRSVYNDIDPSPLYRLIELGFDGIYLDRVDVYEETMKDCPNGDVKMVDFIARLAAHARKKNPHFMVILQNAEDLLRQPKMVAAIDAVAKESLFHGWGGGDGSNKSKVNSSDSVQWSVDRLNIAKKAGRGVFVVDYAANRAAAETSVRKITELGYVPYIGPKALDALWLPGRSY